MSITLPQPIHRRQHGAMPASPNASPEAAVVKDEGKTYVGRDAIRRWKTETSTKYTYASEPFAVAQDGDRTIVTSHVTGNFPGSPVDLRYSFVLEGDKIAAFGDCGMSFDLELQAAAPSSRAVRKASAPPSSMSCAKPVRGLSRLRVSCPIVRFRRCVHLPPI